MTQSDIDYIRDLAEQGQTAPLLGGRIGLMWGSLLTVTLLVHWSILTQMLAVPYYYLGFVWVAFGVTGSILTFVLKGTLKDKPGRGSIGNRIEQAVWGYVGLTLFVMGAGIFCMIMSGRADFQMFDIMIPFSFGMYGMAYLIIAQVSSHKWLRGFGIGALGSVIGACVFFNTPTLYLLGAAVIVVTVVIPEIINMRREPSDLV